MNQADARKRQQLTQKAKSNLRKVIICSKPDCRRVFAYTDDLLKVRRVTEEIEEMGFECPHCGNWYHSCYLNSELRQLRDRITDRQSRRHFQREFNRFQGKAAKRLRGSNGK